MSRARKENLIVGAMPVDLSAAALNGAWVSMSLVDLMSVFLLSGVGTAGDDPVISIQQAQDASGTGAKTLMLQSVDYRIGAGEWVEVATIDDTNPATSYDTDSIDGAESSLVIRVNVRPEDLDINLNYSHIRLNVQDVGSNAQLGAILYVPTGIAAG